MAVYSGGAENIVTVESMRQGDSAVKVLEHKPEDPPVIRRLCMVEETIDSRKLASDLHKYTL